MLLPPISPPQGDGASGGAGASDAFPVLRTGPAQGGTTFGGLAGAFFKSIFEGFTTLDVVDEEALSTPEQIAASLGKVVGFLGIAPGPGTVTRLGVTGALRSFALTRGLAAGITRASAASGGRALLTVGSLPFRAADAVLNRTVLAGIERGAAMRAGAAATGEAGKRAALGAAGRFLTASPRREFIARESARIGLASAFAELPPWQSGPAGALQAGAMGLVEGAGFGLINSQAARILGTALKSSEPGTRAAAGYLLRGTLNAAYAGGLATAQGAETPMVLYHAALGGLLGAVDLPYEEVAARRFLSGLDVHTRVSPEAAPGFDKLDPEVQREVRWEAEVERERMTRSALALAEKANRGPVEGADVAQVAQAVAFRRLYDEGFREGQQDAAARGLEGLDATLHAESVAESKALAGQATAFQRHVRGTLSPEAVAALDAVGDPAQPTRLALDLNPDAEGDLVQAHPERNAVRLSWGRLRRTFEESGGEDALGAFPDWASDRITEGLPRTPESPQDASTPEDVSEDLGTASGDPAVSGAPSGLRGDVASFETARGSAYTVLPDGRIQRFKTVEGKLYDPIALTVFLDVPNNIHDRLGRALYHREDLSLHVVDAEGKIIRDLPSAEGKELFVVVSQQKEDGSRQRVGPTIPATLEPRVGLVPFEYGRATRDGEELSERHLGNRITKITQADPVAQASPATSPVAAHASTFRPEATDTARVSTDDYQIPDGWASPAERFATAHAALVKKATGVKAASHEAEVTATEFARAQAFAAFEAGAGVLRETGDGAEAWARVRADLTAASGVPYAARWADLPRDAREALGDLRRAWKHFAYDEPIRQGYLDLRDGSFQLYGGDGLGTRSGDGKDIRRSRAETLAETVLRVRTPNRKVVLVNAAEHGGQTVPLAESTDPFDWARLVVSGHRQGWTFLGGNKDKGEFYFAEQDPQPYDTGATLRALDEAWAALTPKQQERQGGVPPSEAYLRLRERGVADLVAAGASADEAARIYDAEWVEGARMIEGLGGAPLAQLVREGAVGSGHLLDAINLNKRAQVLWDGAPRADLAFQPRRVRDGRKTGGKRGPDFAGHVGHAAPGHLRTVVVSSDVEGLPAIRDAEGRLQEHHLDGVLFVRQDVFDSLIADVGGDPDAGFLKMTEAFNDAGAGGQGLFVGKLGAFRAPDAIEAEMARLGVDQLMFDSAAKVTGRRPVARLSAVREGRGKALRLRVADPNGRLRTDQLAFDVPVTALRLNTGTLEVTAKNLKDQRAPRQWPTNFRTPEAQGAVWRSVVLPSIRGTETAHNALLAAVARPGDEAALAALEGTDVDDVPLAALTEVLFQPEHAYMTTMGGVYGRLLSKIVARTQDDPSLLDETLTDEGGVAEGVVDADAAARAADALRDYTSVADRILQTAGADLSPAVAHMEPVAPYVQQVVRAYLRARVLRPKVPNSGKGVLYPNDPAMMLGLDLEGDALHGVVTPGFVYFGDAVRRKRVRWVGGQEVTLERALDAYRQEKSPDRRAEMERLLTFHVVRVPADSTSGTRALRFGGFTGRKGAGIVVHNEEMVALGGADLDADSAFYFQDPDSLPGARPAKRAPEGRAFELAGPVRRVADRKLDTAVATWLRERAGFEVEETTMARIRALTGQDAFGVADVLAKTVLVAHNRSETTLPEEAGHVALELMGVKDPDVRALLDGIVNWKGYGAVVERYGELYGNDHVRLRKEAAAKVVADHMARIARGDTTRPDDVDAPLWERVVAAVRRFFERLRGAEAFDVQGTAQRIAEDVLANRSLRRSDPEAYRRSEEAKRVAFDETLARYPSAKQVVERLGASGLALTGSLAVRAQGTLYRTTDETVHDLDWVVPEGWGNKDVDEALARALPEGWVLDRWDPFAMRSPDNPAKWTTQAIAVNERPYLAAQARARKAYDQAINLGQGPMVAQRAASAVMRAWSKEAKERGDLIGFDFFFGEPPSRPTVERQGVPMSRWDTIFAAKLGYLNPGEFAFGRPKDVVDFADFETEVPVAPGENTAGLFFDLAPKGKRERKGDRPMEAELLAARDQWLTEQGRAMRPDPYTVRPLQDSKSEQDTFVRELAPEQRGVVGMADPRTLFQVGRGAYQGNRTLGGAATAGRRGQAWLEALAHARRTKDQKLMEAVTHGSAFVKEGESDEGFWLSFRLRPADDDGRAFFAWRRQAMNFAADAGNFAGLNFDNFSIGRFLSTHLADGYDVLLEGANTAPVPVGWARAAEGGYEVSTAGDRRFSALNARLPDGRTIEEAYQLDVKGYRSEGDSWRLGKGKPPKHEMTREQLYEAYKGLWRQWAQTNPDLVRDLAQRAGGRVLTDRFASTDVSQARALDEVLTEMGLRQSLQGSAQGRSEKRWVRRDDLSAEDRALYDRHVGAAGTAFWKKLAAADRLGDGKNRKENRPYTLDETLGGLREARGFEEGAGVGTVHYRALEALGGLPHRDRSFGDAGVMSHWAPEGFRRLTRAATNLYRSQEPGARLVADLLGDDGRKALSVAHDPAEGQGGFKPWKADQDAADVVSTVQAIRLAIRALRAGVSPERMRAVVQAAQALRDDAAAYWRREKKARRGEEGGAVTEEERDAQSPEQLEAAIPEVKRQMRLTPEESDLFDGWLLSSLNRRDEGYDAFVASRVEEATASHRQGLAVMRLPNDDGTPSPIPAAHVREAEAALVKIAEEAERQAAKEWRATNRQAFGFASRAVAPYVLRQWVRLYDEAVGMAERFEREPGTRGEVSNDQAEAEVQRWLYGPDEAASKDAFTALYGLPEAEEFVPGAGLLNEAPALDRWTDGLLNELWGLAERGEGMLKVEAGESPAERRRRLRLERLADDFKAAVQERPWVRRHFASVFAGVVSEARASSGGIGETPSEASVEALEEFVEFFRDARTGDLGPRPLAPGDRGPRVPKLAYWLFPDFAARFMGRHEEVAEPVARYVVTRGEDGTAKTAFVRAVVPTSTMGLVQRFAHDVTQQEEAHRARARALQDERLAFLRTVEPTDGGPNVNPERVYGAAVAMHELEGARLGYREAERRGEEGRMRHYGLQVRATEREWKGDADAEGERLGLFGYEGYYGAVKGRRFRLNTPTGPREVSGAELVEQTRALVASEAARVRRERVVNAKEANRWIVDGEGRSVNAFQEDGALDSGVRAQAEAVAALDVERTLKGIHAHMRATGEVPQLGVDALDLLTHRLALEGIARNFRLSDGAASALGLDPRGDRIATVSPRALRENGLHAEADRMVAVLARSQGFRFRGTGFVHGYFPRLGWTEARVRAHLAAEMGRADTAALSKEDRLKLQMRVQQAYATGVLGRDDVPSDLLNDVLVADHDAATARLVRRTERAGMDARPGNLRERGDDPIPGWDKSPKAFASYEDAAIRAYHRKLFGLLANRTIGAFEAEGRMGDTTTAWARFMRLYARDVVGYPSVFPDEWLADKDLQLKSSGYYAFTDHAVEARLRWADERLFGGRFFPTVTGPDGKPQPSVPGDLHSEAVSRRIAWWSRLEAKWNFLSLLARPKAAVNNLSQLGTTFVSVGWAPWRQAMDRRWVRDHLADPRLVDVDGQPFRFERFGDTLRFAEKHGVVESFIADELDLGRFAGTREGGAFMADLRATVRASWRKGEDVTDLSVRELAERHGLGRELFQKGAWFMRTSERALRAHAFLAHYIHARRVLDGSRIEYGPEDPWLLHMAKRGVEATQFLYNNASRPAVARTPIGKVAFRFQTWAWNSVRFQRQVASDAARLGFRKGTPEMARFERMAAMNLLAFGLASVFPASFFESTLPQPLGWAKDLSDYLFAEDEEERERAFLNKIPGARHLGPARYLVEPLAMFAPPSFRVLETVGFGDPEGRGFTAMDPMAYAFGLLSGVDVVADPLASYEAWSLYPFGLMARDVAYVARSPLSLVDRLTGLPLFQMQRSAEALQREREDADGVLDDDPAGGGTLLPPADFGAPGR